MEGFPMPWFTKRTASGTGCGISNPWACSSAPPVRTPPNSHHSHLHDLQRTAPLRPAKPAIHRHSWSPLCWVHAPKTRTGLHDLCSTRPVPLRPAKLEIHRHTQSKLRWAAPLTPAKPAIHRHSRSPLAHTPEACQACMISAGPCPLGLPGQQSIGMHDLCRDCILKACQAGDPQAYMISTLPGRALQACQAHAPKAQ
jgi:hypothetical protein